MITFLNDFGTWCIRHPWAVMGVTAVMVLGLWSIRRPKKHLLIVSLTACAAATSLLLWHVGHALGEEIALMRAGLPSANGMLQWAAKNSLGPVIWPTRAFLVALGGVLLTVALRRRQWIAFCAVPILGAALLALDYVV